MTAYSSNDDFVRDLKEAAEHDRDGLSDGASEPQKQAVSRSRAAMLYLISKLARRSVPVLSLVAVMIAVLAGFYVISLPEMTLSMAGRVVYWLGLSTGALFFTAHRLRLYRQGLAYNGRPFSWRAHYTCALAVLSTAMGAAAFLLTPQSLSPVIIVIICSVLFLLGIILGLSHLSHRVTAFAAALPCLTLAILGPVSHFASMPAALQEGTLSLLAGAAALLALAGGWANARHRTIIANALAAHPRHEMTQVTARQKKISAAYNPFSIRLKQQTPAGNPLKPE